MRLPWLQRTARQHPTRPGSRRPALLRRLVNALTPSERRIVLVLVAIVASATTLLVAGRFRASDGIVRGGVYTEGLVAASLADVEPTVQALTQVGLLAPKETGELSGRLAEDWRVSDDAKTFEFHLKPGIDRAAVLAAYNPVTPDSPFVGTVVEPFDERGFRVRLSESYSPFLATFTKPLIPLGPYVVADRQRESVTLVARPDYFEGEPYLETIVLQIFPTNDQLERSLRRSTVDGAAQVSPGLSLPASFKRYELTLPRQTAAFFNLNHPVVDSLDTREKLIKHDRFADRLTLDVVTTETLATQADVRSLIAAWREANVQVQLTVLPAARVQREVIPNRDYDVLIFGIDYGADPDPYPFWHSSQRKAAGLNLANFANVDADKLLEQARTTGKGEERTKRYEQFAAILDREQPWLVLKEAPWQFAVSAAIEGPANRTGFQPADRYRTVHRWHRTR